MAEIVDFGKKTGQSEGSESGSDESQTEYVIECDECGGVFFLISPLLQFSCANPLCEAPPFTWEDIYSTDE